jgi:hypothetical protein
MESQHVNKLEAASCGQHDPHDLGKPDLRPLRLTTAHSRRRLTITDAVTFGDHLRRTDKRGAAALLIERVCRTAVSVHNRTLCSWTAMLLL